VVRIFGLSGLVRRRMVSSDLDRQQGLGMRGFV